MVALIVFTLLTLFVVCVSIAAMKGGQNRISLVLLYVALAFQVVGLFAYGPYESYESERLRDISRAETLEEVYRTNVMIKALGGSGQYLEYLKVIGAKK